MTYLLYLLYALCALAALALLYGLFLAFCMIFIDRGKLYDDDSPFYRFLIDTVVAQIVDLSNVRVTVKGEENLPESGAFLLVGNHISMYDPIVELRVLKSRKLVFVTKPEIMKIPLAGPAIHRCGFMAIDRENPRKAVLTVNRMTDFLKRGRSVAVYPEGTRSKSGELLPFHAGVLKPAITAGAPVVLCRVSGTENVHKNAPFRKTPVTVEFLKTIPAGAFEKSSLLCEHTRDEFLK